MKLQVKTQKGYIEISTDKPYLEPAKCKGCGAEIYWGKTNNGKNFPISMKMEDGHFVYISHFADCKKADNFRKEKAPCLYKEYEIDSRVLCDRCKREIKLTVEEVDQMMNSCNGSGEILCPDCKSDSDLENY
jgi:hypothetical protein